MTRFPLRLGSVLLLFVVASAQVRAQGVEWRTDFDGGSLTPHLDIVETSQLDREGTLLASGRGSVRWRNVFMTAVFAAGGERLWQEVSRYPMAYRADAGLLGLSDLEGAPRLSLRNRPDGAPIWSVPWNANHEVFLPPEGPSGVFLAREQGSDPIDRCGCRWSAHALDEGQRLWQAEVAPPDFYCASDLIGVVAQHAALLLVSAVDGTSGQLGQSIVAIEVDSGVELWRLPLAALDPGSPNRVIARHDGATTLLVSFWGPGVGPKIVLIDAFTGAQRLTWSGPVDFGQSPQDSHVELLTATRVALMSRTAQGSVVGLFDLLADEQQPFWSRTYSADELDVHAMQKVGRDELLLLGLEPPARGGALFAQWVKSDGRVRWAGRDAAGSAGSLVRVEPGSARSGDDGLEALLRVTTLYQGFHRNELVALRVRGLRSTWSLVGPVVEPIRPAEALVRPLCFAELEVADDGSSMRETCVHREALRLADLRVYDRHGEALWGREFPTNRISASYRDARTPVLVRAVNGWQQPEVLAFDARSGRMLERLILEYPGADAARVLSARDAAGSAVGLVHTWRALPEPHLQAEGYRADSLERLWSHALSTELVTGESIDALEYEDGTVVVVSSGGAAAEGAALEFQWLSVTDGRRLSRTGLSQLPQTSQTAFKTLPSRQLAVALPDRQVLLDGHTGDVIWDTLYPGLDVLDSPSLAIAPDGSVLRADAMRDRCVVSAFDVDTGSLLWRWSSEAEQPQPLFVGCRLAVDSHEAWLAVSPSHDELRRTAPKLFRLGDGSSPPTPMPLAMPFTTLSHLHAIGDGLIAGGYAHDQVLFRSFVAKLTPQRVFRAGFEP